MFFSSPRLALLSKCRFHQCYSLKSLFSKITSKPVFNLSNWNVLETFTSPLQNNQISPLHTSVSQPSKSIKLLSSNRVCLCSISQSNYPLQRVFAFTHKPIKLLHSLEQSNKEFRKTVLCTLLLPIWFCLLFSFSGFHSLWKQLWKG